jgi:hypothetical protein
VTLAPPTTRPARQVADADARAEQAEQDATRARQAEAAAVTPSPARPGRRMSLALSFPTAVNWPNIRNAAGSGFR